MHESAIEGMENFHESERIDKQMEEINKTAKNEDQRKRKSYDDTKSYKSVIYDPKTKKFVDTEDDLTKVHLKAQIQEHDKDEYPENFDDFERTILAIGSTQIPWSLRRRNSSWSAPLVL